jgi:hypothetical protein
MLRPVTEKERVRMSEGLTLPDELLDRLEQAATRRGQSVEQLLSELVSNLVPDTEVHSAVVPSEELLAECTRALLSGIDPPIAADWDDIADTLSDSEPPFGSIEEAMSDLRGRAWSKDA